MLFAASLATAFAAAVPQATTPSHASPAEAARPAQPLWTGAARAELSAAIDEAGAHGLSPRAYRALMGDGSESALTRAALAYAGDLARGVTDPGELHAIFTHSRPHVDLEAGLRSALDRGELKAWLASLAPQDATYHALSKAHREAVAAAAEGRWRPIPDGPLIRPGDTDPRVAAIAERLTARGLLEVRAGEGGEVYGEALEGAVRRLQERAGLLLDGVVGPQTLAELNQSPNDRARQLAVNLERWRWLPRQPPATRIDVNIADMALTYVRNGEAALQRRVVAGAVGHKTPLLGESFDRLVVNPPWYVPQSIAREEILPKGQAYLRSRDMYVRDGRVIQRPGPDAALGQVKFDMQNRYAIYLHDTPAQSLFERSDRLRSHGCVRVEGAVDFARRLARERGKGEAFDQALASGETRVVELGEDIPVRLLYFTAVVEPNGKVRYLQDAYGWDAELAQALGLGRSKLRARPPAAADLLGP